VSLNAAQVTELTPRPVRTSGVPASDTAQWPDSEGARIVFLLDASTDIEARLLRRWIADNAPDGHGPYEIAPIPPSRRPREKRSDRALEAALAAGDDPLLAPLRVIWLAAEHQPRPRTTGLAKLLLLGDPYDPGALRQRWLRWRSPQRCRIVAGEPARLSELRERWRSAGGADFSETTGLVDFVARQAALALERAERRVRGMRYKVPRFVQESILERPAFQGGLARLAWESGREVADVRHEAAQYLREIAATHSPYMIDLTAQLCRLMYTRAYGDNLQYDRAELERIYALAQRHPVCFLPSHRSNLDHLVLQYALYENGHPPNHTAGGINMNFLPLGPVFRRSGVFFIRRTFKDNEVYKFVLRHYVDYLVEKRFPLEWYIEGGRSRSGKLLPPRFGLLAYVVDAYRRGKSEDVMVVPVSITYDQIQDVGSYVAEQQGAAKEREGFGWFLRVFRALRRRYGGIHIRFGEPLSMRDNLGAPEPEAEPRPDEQNLQIQKLAFETSVRINQVTPVTPTAMVTLALLAAGDRALSVEETMEALEDVVAYVRKRRLPITEEIDLTARQRVEGALQALVENGVLTCYAGGPETVYAIGPEQHLTAAYYRNTVTHFFVAGAIAELALLAAAEDHVDDRERRFWNEVLRLRDLLKFEFFFPEKDAFRREIADEVTLHDQNWKHALAGGPEPVRALLRSFRPFSAHLVLRPFVEAYSVVADALERRDPEREVKDEEFLAECLGLGKQYRLQKRIRSAESISKVLFATALRLARNRQLVAAAPDVAARRKSFAAEVRDVIRRVEAIDALAASRRARLID
jgi:glycerol-3-phosphate O-acyltransferase